MSSPPEKQPARAAPEPIWTQPPPGQRRPRYTREQARRHDVRPGITGWAQLNGRNRLPWERRFALDLWYVDHQSFRLDLRILLRTVWIALAQAGVSQPGEGPEEHFRGREPASDALADLRT